MTLASRFWAKVDRRGPLDCWEWRGSRNAKGYGRIQRGARGEGVEKAHRIAWELHTGVKPTTKVVLHRCDNPPCCNPAHLFIGSNADNTQDMLVKGRNVPPPTHRRAAHHNTPFTEISRAAMLRDTRVAAVVAEAFGTTATTIYRHRRGESWN